MVVRIDADQVLVECGVMDFRQWDTVGNHWLAEALVFVLHDMSASKSSDSGKPDNAHLPSYAAITASRNDA